MGHPVPLEALKEEREVFSSQVEFCQCTDSQTLQDICSLSDDEVLLSSRQKSPHHSTLTRRSYNCVKKLGIFQNLSYTYFYATMNLYSKETLVTLDKLTWARKTCWYNKAQRVPTVAKAKRFEKIFWFEEFNLGWF